MGTLCNATGFAEPKFGVWSKLCILFRMKRRDTIGLLIEHRVDAKIFCVFLCVSLKQKSISSAKKVRTQTHLKAVPV